MHNYHIIIIILATFYCYSCSDDFEALEVPDVAFADLSLVAVSSTAFEATIIDGDTIFQVEERGFIVSECPHSCLLEKDSCAVEFIKVEVDDCGDVSRKKFCGSTNLLEQNKEYYVSAFIKVRYTENDSIRKICSNIIKFKTGTISVVGLSSIVEEKGVKRARLTAGISAQGIDLSKLEYGFLWYGSDRPLLSTEQTDPEELFNSNPNMESLTDSEFRMDTVLAHGLFHYIMPFVKFDNKLIFDIDDQGRPIYQEIFIGDAWQKTDIRTNGMSPRGLANAVSFSVGNNGYIGTGFTDQDKLTDGFWSYNPDDRRFRRLIEVPGGKRQHAIGFCLKDKGYIGLGQGENELLDDFYQYDATVDRWDTMACFPFPLTNAISFVIGNKAYVATGETCLMNLPTADCYNTELYEFDPSGGQGRGEWQYIQQWPSDANAMISHAVGLSVLQIGYVATGLGPDSVHLQSVHQYANNTRIFTGSARREATSFVIDDHAFILGGIVSDNSLSDVWQSDENVELWSNRADLPVAHLHGASAFTIGKHGYVYGGFTDAAENSISQNMYIYTPEIAIIYPQ